VSHLEPILPYVAASLYIISILRCLQCPGFAFLDKPAS
jgi:hypothetical protein